MTVHRITALDIIRASKGIRIPNNCVYSSTSDVSTPSKLAQNLKLNMFEYAWSTGNLDWDLKLQRVTEECGDLLPQVLRELWLDGFDIDFHIEWEKYFRRFLIFWLPAKSKVWRIKITAASQSVRTIGLYIPISIPTSNLEN